MSERDEAHAFLELFLGLSLVGQHRDVTLAALERLLARVRAEGYAAGLEAGRAAERGAVVAWLNNTRIGASWAIGIEAGEHTEDHDHVNYRT